jgi:hypothetical protein
MFIDKVAMKEWNSQFNQRSIEAKQLLDSGTDSDINYFVGLNFLVIIKKISSFW